MKNLNHSSLSNSESNRYEKHLLLPKFGLEGQLKLKNARVLVVGAGGLGCPVLQYLAAAGIGKIGIIDGDKVSMSNLQRQILYTEHHVGFYKADVAKQKLNLLNPHIEIDSLPYYLKGSKAMATIAAYDLVVDCTDNFEVRYLINDICVAQQKPLVYGAIHKFEGQISVFNYTDTQGNKGPTYRCVFPNSPHANEIPNCAQVGVLGILPGIMGLFQANEVIKIIAGIGEVLSGKILLLDLLCNTQRTIKVKRQENAESLIQLPNFENFEMKEISPAAFQKELEQGTAFHIIDVRQPEEWEICKLDGATLLPLPILFTGDFNIKLENKTLVYCHHGMRSAKAIELLMPQFPGIQFYNLEGGIDAWATEIDKDMPRYC